MEHAKALSKKQVNLTRRRKLDRTKFQGFRRTISRIKKTGKPENGEVPNNRSKPKECQVTISTLQLYQTNINRMSATGSVPGKGKAWNKPKEYQDDCRTRNWKSAKQIPTKVKHINQIKTLERLKLDMFQRMTRRGVSQKNIKKSLKSGRKFPVFLIYLSE